MMLCLLATVAQAQEKKLELSSTMGFAGRLDPQFSEAYGLLF